ncbi:rhomboid family intramembrane serine protease [Calditrichota bacterium GD2]
MIPIADESPRGYRPYVNYALITLNILAYFFWQQHTQSFIYTYGLVPAKFFSLDYQPFATLTIFTSMFMHGGLGHLFGNMLYLYIFGDNIEYTLGHARYLLFYLTVGVAAALLQTFLAPNSTIPMVGASGAISGVLGAYLLKFPRNRISILIFIFFFIDIIHVPAVFVLSLWFIFQLFNGWLSLIPGLQGGVAWFAHIGGFAAGFTLIKFFEPRRRWQVWL